MGVPADLASGLMAMDTATIAVVIAGVALVVNIGVQVLGGGWRLSTKLSNMEISLNKAISDAKDEIEARQDKIVREFGETAAAIRQKLHEVEIWARDEFVRKEGFYKVRDDMSSDLKSLGDKIEARLERMESKIDRSQ